MYGSAAEYAADFEKVLDQAARGGGHEAFERLGEMISAAAPGLDGERALEFERIRAGEARAAYELLMWVAFGGR